MDAKIFDPIKRVVAPVADAGETVAVNMTGCNSTEGFGDDVSVTVVFCFCTWGTIVNVTGTVVTLFDVPTTDISTEPEYIPIASPLGFAETVMDPGTGPISGLMDNQFPPVAVAV